MHYLALILFCGGAGVWAGIKITGGFDSMFWVLVLLLVGYVLYKKGGKL